MKIILLSSPRVRSFLAKSIPLKGSIAISSSKRSKASRTSKAPPFVKRSIVWLRECLSSIIFTVSASWFRRIGSSSQIAIRYKKITVLIHLHLLTISYGVALLLNIDLNQSDLITDRIVRSLSLKVVPLLSQY